MKKPYVFNSQVTEIAELFSNLEGEWLSENKRIELITEIKKKISDLATCDDPILKKLAKSAEHIHTDSELEHLLNYLIPFERLLDKNITDADFLVLSEDQSVSLSAPAPLVLVADNIRSAFNVGSMLRTAECLHATKVWLTGYSPVPIDKKTAKASMGAENYILWEHHRDLSVVLQQLKNEGYSLVALETVKEANTIYDSSLPEKVAFIVGNERFGLSEKILSQVDQILRLPVFGRKNSLNVGVCFAAAGFEWRRQHNLWT